MAGSRASRTRGFSVDSSSSCRDSFGSPRIEISATFCRASGGWGCWDSCTLDASSSSGSLPAPLPRPRSTVQTARSRNSCWASPGNTRGGTRRRGACQATCSPTVAWGFSGHRSGFAVIAVAGEDYAAISDVSIVLDCSLPCSYRNIPSRRLFLALFSSELLFFYSSSPFWFLLVLNLAREGRNSLRQPRCARTMKRRSTLCCVVPRVPSEQRANLPERIEFSSPRPAFSPPSTSAFHALLLGNDAMGKGGILGNLSVDGQD